MILAKKYMTLHVSIAYCCSTTEKATYVLDFVATKFPRSSVQLNLIVDLRRISNMFGEEVVWRLLV